MNAPLTHSINTRSLITYGEISSEQIINKKHNYLFDLSYLGVIDVVGDKSVDFLQGQLTADLRLISDIQMVQAAQCNLKGRVLALLDVLKWNGIKLILPRDLIDATQSSLAKTAMLSRVRLQQNSDLKIWGFYLQDKNDLLPEPGYFPDAPYAQAQGPHYCYYHLGNGFYIFILGEHLVQEFIKPFIDHNRLLGSLTWHTLRLNQKQLNIYPESRGLFLPHRIDLHQTPYLSFDKGCYKGQEIIARTHYRATLKHELKLFRVNTKGAVYSGQKLFKVDEEIEAGEVIDFSFLDEDVYLIAVSMIKESITRVRFEGHSEATVLQNN
ncbi:MAG TPA: folate-binding protein YgfZ [Legionella sp.]|nr:folate-binding protein YgfZ [Legionella sp.]